MGLSPEDEAARQATIEQAMADAGQVVVAEVAIDYFAFNVSHTVDLSGGQWVQHKELNEGDKRAYMNSVNRSVKTNKVSGDLTIDMKPGDERYQLLKAAISGFNLQRAGQPVQFSTRTLDDFLKMAPPSVMDLIEKDVRKHNPWLNADVTVEAIDAQIAELQELRDKKVAEAEGEASSSSK